MLMWLPFGSVSSLITFERRVVVEAGVVRVAVEGGPVMVDHVHRKNGSACHDGDGWIMSHTHLELDGG